MISRLLVTPAEPAAMLSMSCRTLERRTDIPHLMVGGSKRYSVRDLEAWVAAQRRQAEPLPGRVADVGAGHGPLGPSSSGGEGTLGAVT